MVFYKRLAALFIGFFLLGPVFGHVSAATLSFDPSSINTTVNGTFDLDIVANTGGAEVLGVDALFEYDPDMIEATVVSDGTFLEINHKEIKDSGAVYVVGLVNSPGEAVEGEGVLATVSFKAKKSGTVNLSYTCEINDTRESNILESSPDSPDLLECSQNGKATIVIGGGASDQGGNNNSTDNTTTTKTSTGGSELPKTGVVENILVGVTVGGILLLIGVAARFMI